MTQVKQYQLLANVYFVWIVMNWSDLEWNEFSYGPGFELEIYVVQPIFGCEDAAQQVLMYVCPSVRGQVEILPC